MPTRIMRRTPATEEAASYGYGDLLKDTVRGLLAGGAAQSRRMLEGRMTEDDFMDLAFAGIGAGTKIAGGLGKGKFPFSLKTTPRDPIKAAETKFHKLGLKYDAYSNPLPDKPEFASHQWTFYGEGPLHKASVYTKGTGMEEVTEMVADRLRKFSE